MGDVGGPAVGSSVVTPGVRSFLDDLAAAGQPPSHTRTPAEARRGLRDRQAIEVARPPVDVEDRMIPGGPDGQVSFRVVRPEGAGGSLPAVMYFHGGGWILGDADTHDRIVRELAIGADAALVFVNYTLSPEAGIRRPLSRPTRPRGGWPRRAPVRAWTPRASSSSATARGGHGGRRDPPGKAPGRAGDRLPDPGLPGDRRGLRDPLLRRFADGPSLTRKAMRWFWDAYAPDPSAREEPTASPFGPPSRSFRAWPRPCSSPARTTCCAEGEACAHRLMEAGVTVTAVRYLGTIHDFLLLNAIARAAPTRAALAQITATLRGVLEP